MIREFRFEDHNGQILTVELYVWAKDLKGNYGFDSVSLWTSENEMVLIESLTNEDKKRLAERCEKVAYESAESAYHEHLIGQADRLYDGWEGPDVA